MAFYNWVHHLGMCTYLLPTILVAVIMVAVGVGHTYKQNKREKDFEKELEEQGASKEV